MRYFLSHLHIRCLDLQNLPGKWRAAQCRGGQDDRRQGPGHFKNGRRFWVCPEMGYQSKWNGEYDGNMMGIWWLMPWMENAMLCWFSDRPTKGTWNEGNLTHAQVLPTPHSPRKVDEVARIACFGMSKENKTTRVPERNDILTYCHTRQFCWWTSF